MRSKRLEEAIRRNRRKRDTPLLMQRVQAVAGLTAADITHISMEESERLNQEFHRVIDELRNSRDLMQYGPVGHAHALQEAERVLGRRVDIDLWVILSHWITVGALKLSARKLARCCFQLLDIDGDTVYGGTESLYALFLADYQRDKDRYEILHWGWE